jgi:hypothetical protein
MKAQSWYLSSTTGLFPIHVEAYSYDILISSYVLSPKTSLIQFRGGMNGVYSPTHSSLPAPREDRPVVLRMSKR